MKTLLSYYIMEARELLKDKFNLITLEEFTEYVTAMDNWDEDAEIVKKVRDIITTACGEKVYKAFESYIQKIAWKAVGGDSYEEYYNTLLNIPTSRLPKILGAGSFSTAFKIGNNAVVKRSHDLEDGFDKIEMKFYNYLLKENKCPYFPKVYKLSKHLVVMEKLDMTSGEISDYVQMLMSTDFTTNTPKNVYPKFAHTPLDKIVVDDIKTGKDTLKEKGIDDAFIRKVYEWYKEIYKILESLGLQNKIDLSAANVGKRADGTLVFFDAVSSM